MKKYLFFIILVFFLINFNSKVCNLNNFYHSSLDFGFVDTFSFCKKKMISNYKKSIKKIIIKTPFEMQFREKFTNKNNYQYVNLKDFNKYQLHEDKNKKILFRNLKNKKNNLKEKKNLINDSEFWNRSHGGNLNHKFSNSNSINIENIKNIKLKWKYKSNNKHLTSIQNNPIYFDNSIYLLSGDKTILSLNSSNGNVNWKLRTVFELNTRGITIDVKEKQLYLPLNKRVYKIDIKNGKINKKFGNNGYVEINTIVAPIIKTNEICFATVAPAKIICVNKTNGMVNFKINVHPKDKNFKKGGAIWGGIAYDKKLNNIYVVTGNPRPALVGIGRKGNNNNSNSIVGINLDSKKIIWSFQDIKHDLWDYDLAAPPILTDIKISETEIFESVIVGSKTGTIYILDRNNGNPYFNLVNKKSPPSKILGEQTASYQIRQEKLNNLINLDLDINSFNESTIETYNQKFNTNYFDMGEFVPPKLGGETIIMGLHGGITWPGMSLNPKNQLLFVPVNKIPYSLKVELKTHSTLIPNSDDLNLYLNKCSSCHGKYRNGNFEFKSSFFNKKNSEMDSDNNYIPSLIGHSFFNKNFANFLNKNYVEKLHKNLSINENEINRLKKLFYSWDELILKESEMYFKYNWKQFINKDNKFATKPPWGEVVGIDLVSGKKLWKRAIGSSIGTPIYGGLASNLGEILVVTGTSDNKVYFLNQNNGEILHELELEGPGTAPPIIYSNKHSSNILIISSGMHYPNFDKNSQTIIYNFSLQ
ncbi:outer membrane protein assembly factor BamB family protein [Candidatus Pelagibacter sp. HIMB1509]|uniref:outer membrane protein assembly factor BamB family protein n=1 Tax=Candidatus Pelagibacter sp. HIMB1509 TaxID=3413339 RepID=UPI003F84BE85